MIAIQFYDLFNAFLVYHKTISQVVNKSNTGFGVFELLKMLYAFLN